MWHLRHILDGQTYQAHSQETQDSAQRVVVIPRPREAEVQGFTGGYTVKRHGLADDVDAVQLEFGRSFRETTEARWFCAMNEGSEEGGGLFLVCARMITSGRPTRRRRVVKRKLFKHTEVRLKVNVLSCRVRDI